MWIGCVLCSFDGLCGLIRQIVSFENRDRDREPSRVVSRHQMCICRAFYTQQECGGVPDEGTRVSVPPLRGAVDGSA
jgi:hypothetical protein